MNNKDSRVQFYANKDGVRRILSFKVHSKEDAMFALVRMNVPAGWYLENAGSFNSEKIINPYYVRNFKKIQVKKFFK